MPPWSVPIGFACCWPASSFIVHLPSPKRRRASMPSSSATGGGISHSDHHRSDDLARLHVRRRRARRRPTRSLRHHSGQVELAVGASWASIGKSSAGTWSPPCETRMRSRRSKSVLERHDRLRSRLGQADVDERAGVPEHARALPRSRAGRRRRRRSRAARLGTRVGRAEAARGLELALVEVERVDLGGAGDPRALDHREPDGAAADHADARALPDARRVRAPSRRPSRPRSRSGRPARAVGPCGTCTRRGAVDDRPRRERAGLERACQLACRPCAASARPGPAASGTGGARPAAHQGQAPQGERHPSTTRSPARRARRPRRPPRRRRRPRGRAGSAGC